MRSITSWRDVEEVSYDSVSALIKDIENFKKQTNFTLIKQTMMNREWETEADSQSFVKELSVVTKSFSKKVD